MSEPSGTQYGGFWVRFLALLADSAIVFLICAALLVGAAMALGPEAVVPAVFAVWVVGFLYWPVMHASRRQATFGKAIVGLKVARFDGRRISILRSLWREIAKAFSAALLMLGYVMAAFTPRKQGLHDLMSATYVVREGASGVIPALVVAVAGFALPVFVGPMIGAAAVMSTVAGMAEGMVGQPLPIKLASPPVNQPAKPKPIAPKPQPQATPTPAPVAAAPKPAPEPQKAVEAPKPVVEAPKVVETPKPLEAVKAVEAPKQVEAPKPIALAEAKPLPAAKPKAPPKPKAVPTKAVAKATKPPASPPSEPKRASGPRYNDLMTAVLYRDVDSVNELLKLGKWADKPDSRGVTPLMVATELGDVRAAEALPRAGADPRLALPIAEERRNSDMIQLLKRHNGR